MSSNIKVQRVCQNCGIEFTARTTVTKYCGDICAKKAYKAKIKDKKVASSDKETAAVRLQPVRNLKGKEYLSVREVALILNTSSKTVYRLIHQGNLKATNIGLRKTIVRKADIDELFREPLPGVEFNITDCYSVSEVKEKYQVSESLLYTMMRNGMVPRIKQGMNTYVPKSIIDNLLQ
jgi:excisionase family DNA binding protein